jgi:hypothetical protein
MQEGSPPPFDPSTTIIAPANSWCEAHWRRVVEDPGANSVFCSFRVITRLLELDRFYDLAYPDGRPEVGQSDIRRINAALAKITPLCCWLGDEEIGMMLVEARAINEGRPKS